MTENKLYRISSTGDSKVGLSNWEDLLLVGKPLTVSKPKERFFHVFNDKIDSGCIIRAGVWEATSYAEELKNYPFHEIVFIVEGSIFITDHKGEESTFKVGECFFIEKGFNGIWRQSETAKIFHMTVDPQEN